jgi:DNA-directed RNA polymerase specialized sigma24 family protein
MDGGWKDSNAEVSKAIMMYQGYANKACFSNMDVRIKEDAVQETVLRLLKVEKFFLKMTFDLDIKKYGFKVFHNVITDLARKEGVFRYSTKDDDTDNKTVQNFTEEYNTTEVHSEDEPFFTFMSGGKPVTSSNEPAKIAEDEDIGKVVAEVVNGLLASKEYTQRMFLYHAVWNDKMGLKLNELAKFVGYEASNLPQIVKRFKDEIIKELKSKRHDIGFNEDDDS